MAKFTITIEDQKDGTVKVQSSPTFEKIMTDWQTGKQIATPAGNYYMGCINKVREISKDPSAKIKIPKLKAVPNEETPSNN